MLNGDRQNRARRSFLNNNSEEAAVGERRHRPDRWLLVITAVLMAIGLMVIYSISPALAQTSGVSGSYFVTRQIIAIVLGIVAFIVTANIPLSTWRKNYKWLIGAAALATAIAIILPVNPNYPAHRWVRFAGFSLESVELVKFALLFWLAGFLTVKIKNGQINDFRRTVWPLAAALFIIGVIVAFIQSDLGSTGVIVAMMGVMAFVAGLPLRKALMIGAVIVIGTVLAVAATPYRRARLETFLHPTSNCQSAGYQACQALIAVGSGGVIGLGLGSSVQAYGYVPESDNDSIFAIYAEKFGFIGSVILLAIFTLLFYRISLIAERAPDEFTRLIVIGILTWISVQTIINIGAMIGLLPLKGITLPFISYGGTSVVFFSAAIGVVYQISRYSAFSSPRVRSHLSGRAMGYDHSTHRRRVGGAYNPDFGSRG